MHLQKLEDEGKIKRNPSMQRSIELCEPKPDLCRNLPLVGAVAAGSPILAVDNIQEYISLPPVSYMARMKKKPSCFRSMAKA